MEDYPKIYVLAGVNGIGINCAELRFGEIVAKNDLVPAWVEFVLAPEKDATADFTSIEAVREKYTMTKFPARHPFLIFLLFLLPFLHRQPAFSQSDYRIEKYNSLNGLTQDHWVKDVKADPQGMIWLALHKGGLARFDGESFTFYPLPAKWQRSQEVAMQALEIDRRGKFWALAYNQIFSFDPLTGQFSIPELSGIPGNVHTWIFGTSKGDIVLYSGNNLYLISPDHPNQATKIGSTAENLDFGEVEISDRGDLWLYAPDGFHQYSSGKLHRRFGFNHTPENPFPIIPPASRGGVNLQSGGLWYMDATGVLFKSDKQGKTLERYAMKEFKYLSSILETGDIRWFGTFDGLIKVSQRSARFQTWLEQPFDLASGAVTGRSCYGLAESRSGSVFTTSEHHVFEIFPNEPGKTRLLPSTSHTRRYGKMTDQQGRIWFSLNGNLVDVFEPETGSIQRIQFDSSLQFSNSFLQTQRGQIWVGCVQGIATIDPETMQPGIFPLPEKDYVWHLHQSENGTVWAATKNGLLKITPLGGGAGGVTRFHPTNTPGMAAAEILSIHEAAGFLWLGTTGGLVRFHPQTGKAATFTAASGGLPNDMVYAAVPAEGFLWLPTNKGLARVSLASALQENADMLDVSTFGTDDGLPHHEFNTLTFLKAKNGKIWLGGLNGIVCFDPKDLLPQPSENKNVLIAEFSKYDQRADSLLTFSIFKSHSAEPFILRPKEKFFTVRFALLDYRNPKANQYSYLLEGFDPDWIFAGNQSTLRYANLPPGTYKLRIRGANQNGTWSKQEASATVIVQQIWYKTAWAWAAYVLLAAGLGYLAWRLRLRQVRLAHQLEMEHARSRDLQELEEFKSRFFTNITHEFRTPLTVVLGNLEIMKLEIERQVAQFPISQFLISKISLTRRNAESLLRLINQILDLAKLESNSLKINYVQGDVLPYLRYISESLHSLANARNVMLRVESSEPKIGMDYDPERLMSIVHNLLSNAIKFTPSGGRVTLCANHGDFQNHHDLNLTVTDTGVGIPPEDLPNIFDRFYQAGNSAVSTSSANSTWAGAGGTGIGLSLTKELVKALGGEISVESEVGKGTVFSVRLPITQNAPASDRVTSSHPVTLQVPDNLGGNLKLPPKLTTHEAELPSILLVEDNPDVVEYLAACLRENYQLDFACNGRAGIEKALETVPDLIISDVMMPEKDGFEVCDFLKNDGRTSHIPIILLTAKADVESRIKGLKRGADAYLAKPFHHEELTATLENLLELRRKLQAKYVAAALAAEPAAFATATTEGAGKPDQEHEFLQKVRALVEKNLSNAELEMPHLERSLAMSRSQIFRKIKALTGKSPTLFVRSVRLQNARHLLKTTALTVSEIAYETGFSSPQFFSDAFLEEFGARPSATRN